MRRPKSERQEKSRGLFVLHPYAQPSRKQAGLRWEFCAIAGKFVPRA